MSSWKGVGIICVMGLIAVNIKVFAIGVEPPEVPSGKVEAFMFSGIIPSPTAHPDSVKSLELQKQLDYINKQLTAVTNENNSIKVEAKANSLQRQKVITAIANNLGGVFKGKAEYIYNTSKAYNLNPMLVTAIIFHETGNGNSSACRNLNNPGGLMGNNGLIKFGSIENGIERMCKVLKEGYIDQGRTTIESIQTKYCPIGASNDPQKINHFWLPNVTTKYQKILSESGGTI